MLFKNYVNRWRGVIFHEGWVSQKVILHDEGGWGVRQKVVLYVKRGLGVNNKNLFLLLQRVAIFSCPEQL